MIQDSEKLIEKEKQRLEGLDVTTKEIEPLKLNNILLKLELFKDNEKTLLKILDQNKESKETLDLIQDMTYTMDNKQELEKALENIESKSDKGMLEKAKRMLRYSKIYTADTTGVRIAEDTSAYELGNKVDTISRYKI